MRVSGRKMAMKVAESGQLVANSCDWVMPRDTGKARAMTPAVVVRVWERRRGRRR